MVGVLWALTGSRWFRCPQLQVAVPSPSWELPWVILAKSKNGWKQFSSCFLLHCKNQLPHFRWGTERFLHHSGIWRMTFNSTQGTCTPAGFLTPNPSHTGSLNMKPSSASSTFHKGSSLLLQLWIRETSEPLLACCRGTLLLFPSV